MLGHGSGLPSSALDRAHDALIGAAAADVRTHVFDDLVTRRLWVLLEQVGGAHDLSGLAVAALRHLLGQPGLLQRVRCIRRQPLDRRHRFACDLGHLDLAGERAPAVDVHRAGTAQPGAAAELGACELEAFPDHPQQRRCRRRVGGRRLAVHSEVDGHGVLRGYWGTANVGQRPGLPAFLGQCRFDPCRIERQVADALAGGIGEGVGNGGNGWALRALARAERTLARAVDQLDLDLGRFRHGEDRIALPITRQDAVLVEAHLFFQRPTHGLDDAAFNLAREPVRIDDQAGIDRRPYPRHTDRAARTIDLDVGDAGDVAGEVLVLGEADAAAACAVALLPLFPTRLPGDRLDHRTPARIL